MYHIIVLWYIFSWRFTSLLVSLSSWFLLIRRGVPAQVGELSGHQWNQFFSVKLWKHPGSGGQNWAFFLMLCLVYSILNKGLHCRLLGQWNRRRMVIGHDSPRFHGFGDARPWVNRQKVGLFLRVAIVYEGERWVNLKQQNWLLRAAKGW